LLLDTLSQEAVTFLTYWGDPGLGGATRAFENLLDSPLGKGEDRHPLVDEYLRCRYLAEQCGVLEIDRATRKVVYATPPQDRTDDMRTLLGLKANFRPYQQPGRLPKIPNVLYGHLAGTLVRCLLRQGAKPEARDALKGAQEVLRARGVKENVLSALARRWAPELVE
jgi:hypothetical protein